MPAFDIIVCSYSVGLKNTPQIHRVIVNEPCIIEIRWNYFLQDSSGAVTFKACHTNFTKHLRTNANTAVLSLYIKLEDIYIAREY